MLVVDTEARVEQLLISSLSIHVSKVLAMGRFVYSTSKIHLTPKQMGYIVWKKSEVIPEVFCIL